MGGLDPDFSFESLVGATIAAGKYRLEHIIGSGSMGTVYKGLHLDLEREVAVKILDPKILHISKGADRFKREARSASKLIHRNTVQVLDFGTTNDLYYIVMEHLDGQDLNGFLLDQGKLSSENIAHIMNQVCSALAVAHDHSIIHRDIKPENIILVEGLDDDGQPYLQVKVLDFGIAKILHDEAEDGNVKPPSLTQIGEVLGTPEFMSPEQCQGFKLEPTSDIYACGVLMFAMATGEVPFSGRTHTAVMMQHVVQAAKPPSSVEPSVPPPLDAIVLRCLEKEPIDRYQNARELRSALRALLNIEDTISTLIPISELLEAEKGNSEDDTPPSGVEAANDERFGDTLDPDDNVLAISREKATTSASETPTTIIEPVKKPEPPTTEPALEPTESKAPDNSQSIAFVALVLVLVAIAIGAVLAFR